MISSHAETHGQTHGILQISRPQSVVLVVGIIFHNFDKTPNLFTNLVEAAFGAISQLWDCVLRSSLAIGLIGWMSGDTMFGRYDVDSRQDGGNFPDCTLRRPSGTSKW